MTIRLGNTEYTKDSFNKMIQESLDKLDCTPEKGPFTLEWEKHLREKGDDMDKSGYYYMAHPYSIFATSELTDEQKKQEFERQFDLSARAAGWLMDPEQGFKVISPITHCHPVAVRHKLPRTWDYWKEIDHCYIDGSIGMIIVMNPGWEESEGVTAEIEYAKATGKPIYYLQPIDIDNDVYCFEETIAND